MRKQYLTAAQISARAEKYNGIRNTAEINRLFRMQDDSDKWPINGRFNVTERAIRRVRNAFRDSGYETLGLGYALALQSEMSNIVNSGV